jgi:hypothetical protein
MEGELDAVVRKVIEAAKSGDMVAARLVVDKLVPAAKDRPLGIDLPTLVDAKGCAEAQGKVVAAVAEGELLPSEGHALSGLIENQRRSFETLALEQRLQAIEDRLSIGARK